MGSELARILWCRATNDINTGFVVPYFWLIIVTFWLWIFFDQTKGKLREEQSNSASLTAEVASKSRMIADLEKIIQENNEKHRQMTESANVLHADTIKVCYLSTIFVPIAQMIQLVECKKSRWSL